MFRFRKAPKIILHAKVDACIDGTSSDSVSNTSMSIDLIALLSEPGEPELKMTFKVSQKGNYSEKDLSKK